MTHVNVFLQISKYEQLQELGEGGTSDVYKVRDRDTGEIYAAKISRDEVSQEFQDEKSTFFLFREVKLFSALNHPSILKFIGYSSKDFEGEQNPTIIIEYAQNGSLRNVLELASENKNLDLWDDTKKYINLYGIASGMNYLHSHDILHRDLKPDNILMDEKLYPKISDFGLSKSQNFCEDFKIEEINTGQYKGTTLYIPPEVNSNEEFTKAGDVYSFGLIAYQIFENKPKIFEDHDFISILNIAFYGKRPEITSNIPEPLKNLISNCWSHDPLKRPTFSEVLNELKKLEYLTEKVDEEAYFDYVEMVDDVNDDFDINKRSIQFNEFIQGRFKTRMRSNAVRGPPKFSINDEKTTASHNDIFNSKNTFSTELSQIKIALNDENEKIDEKKMRQRRKNVFKPPENLFKV